MTSMDKHYITISWNHVKTPMKFRDSLMLNRVELQRFSQLFLENKSHLEIAVLLTCNRVEFYVLSEKIEAVLQCIKDMYSDSMDRKIDWSNHSPEIFINHNSFRHLCQVASGIKSMVIGEIQILSQVKLAYEVFKGIQPNAKMLSRFFIDAIECSKKIRKECELTDRSNSISALALKKAKKEFNNLKDCTILILGAGEMATLTAHLFKEYGINKIFIANRNRKRGKLLSEKVHGDFIKMEEMNSILIKCDVIVAATHSNRYLLDKKHITTAMKEGKEKLLLLDIGSPRNLDPSIHGIDNVYLCDLDMLNPFFSDKKQEFQELLEKADIIIQNQDLELMHDMCLENSSSNKMELEEAGY